MQKNLFDLMKHFLNHQRASLRFRVSSVQVTITDLGVQLVASLSLSISGSPGNYQALQLAATAADLLHTPKQVKEEGNIPDVQT